MAFVVEFAFALRSSRRLWFTWFLFVLASAGLIRPAYATQAATTTTLVVTSGGSAATTVAQGAAVTLTATVQAGGAPVTPGQVKFCDTTTVSCKDTRLLGTGQLLGTGTSTLTVRPGIGTHNYFAVFLGTTGDATSQSSVTVVTVTGSRPTSTAIFPSSTASDSPYAVAVTGLLSGSNIPLPTGTLSVVNTNNSNAVVGTFNLPPASTPATVSLAGTVASATGLTGAGLIAVGDFNGDGRLDQAVVTGGSSISILLGNGDGTFTTGTTTAAIGTITAMVVADFNGDGKQDLAYAVGTTSIGILLGNGDGTFTAGTTATATATVAFLVAADFNGDGLEDLAGVTNSTENSSTATSSTVAVLLGSGTGTFTATPSSPTVVTAFGPLLGLFTGDFNGDGLADLASGNTALFTDLLSNGDGTFRSLEVYNEYNPLPESGWYLFYALSGAAVGDFNGDGIDDLVLTGTTQVEVGEEIFVPSGAATLTVPGTTSGQPTANTLSSAALGDSLMTGDFNGDGITDLFSGGETLLGTGTGAFVVGPYGFPGAMQATLNGSTVNVYEYAFYTTANSSVGVGDFAGQGASEIAVHGTSTATATADLEALLQPAETAAVSLGRFDNLGPGSFHVQADYPGDTYYALSVSSVATVAGTDATTLSLSVSPTSAVIGQSVTLTATLSPYSAQGVTTDGETIEFLSGSRDVFLGGLVSGVARVTLSTTAAGTLAPGGESLAVGTSSLSASYKGDTNFLTSTSPSVSYVVSALPTTLSLAVSPASGSPPGQSVTLTATLSPYTALGATTNGEKVMFYSGTTSLGTGTLASGVATLSLTSLPLGTDTLTAVYAGDPTLAASTSPIVSYTVSKVATTLSLAASPASGSTVNELVTLTATLSPYTAQNATSNGEKVTFYSGTTSLGTGTLASGVATLTVGTLPTGTNALTAVYAGETAFSAATSRSVSYVVSKVATALWLSASPASGSTVGASVTLTAALTPSTTRGAAAGGSVTFYSGMTSLGAASLSNGTATLSVSALAAGTDSIQAVYAGDPAFVGATSNTLSYPVVGAPTVTFVVPSKTYGTAPFTVSASSASSGAITYSVASGPATIAGSTVSVTGVGTVVLETSQAATSGFLAATQTATFQVAPEPLLVTASNAARVFGAANPTLTGSVTGAVNGDSFTETFSTTAVESSPVGSYPIVPTVAGSKLADYTVTATDGALTISQAGTATTFALSNSNLTLTATVASLTSGVPTGNIAFYEGETLVGTAALSGGVATYSASSFPSGDVVVTAEYSGDVDFTQSAAPSILVLTVTPSLASVSVPQTGSVTDTLSLAPAPGYTGTVQFSCSNLPANVTCSFSPSSLAFSSSSSKQSVTVTLQTGVATQSSLAVPAVFGGRHGSVLAAALGGPGLLALMLARRRRKAWAANLLLLLLLGVAGMSVSACGGASSGSGSTGTTSTSAAIPTPTGAYTVGLVVSGSAGLTQTSNVTLNVQ